MPGVLVLLQGQVFSIAVAAPALFTGGQDCSIRVWQYNEQAGIFMAAVSCDSCSHNSNSYCSSAG